MKVKVVSHRGCLEELDSIVQGDDAGYKGAGNAYRTFINRSQAESYRIPTMKIARTPSLLFSGRFKLNTTGIGRKSMFKSETAPHAPCATPRMASFLQFGSIEASQACPSRGAQ